MQPTYNDGDWLLFKSMKQGDIAQVQAAIGKVVVIERESYPGILYIKRLIRIDSSGCWVEGDNKEGSTDSRNWGALSCEEIIGLVLARYRRDKTKA